MVVWGTCIHSPRRITSLVSRVSSSRRTICVVPAKPGRWLGPNIPQRLSWRHPVPSSCSMNLFGPTHYSTFSTTTNLYGFVFVDDYSRYTWVHILLYKSEVQGVFRRFANRCMTNYNIKIKHYQEWQRHRVQEHRSRYLSWLPWYHSRVLCSIHTTAERRCGAQERDTYWDGSHHAWWTQDAKKILAWSHWHCMPHHQQSISS